MEHLIVKDIPVCFLLSARWPEGAPMLQQSPFELLGIRSASWSSIGVLVRTDALHAASVLEDCLTERTILLGVSATGSTEFDIVTGGVLRLSWKRRRHMGACLIQQWQQAT